jgi:tetratricopeptide (TPR) repeat protein
MSGLTRNPDGSVQFKERTRRDAPLPINLDRLNYFAKKDLSHGKLEEAQEFYWRAIGIDPADGRAYLGLSRIAQRRGDLEYARSLLRQGIQRSVRGFVEVRGPVEEDGKAIVGRSRENKKKIVKEAPVIGTIRDNGPNPFLLQALGALEQKTGNIGAAEDLYLQALRSRPSHAAAWVSLAQLRTKELRQGARAGRICYQSAEHELKRIGAKPNAFVYTAWARNEYVKGDEGTIRRARELYQLALEADPNCSTAYLQLGAMESECGNFDRARECFEKVLKFDRRNSRVLQAYAIMESRRPREEVDSRQVLHLFEKALKANPRDAGVYQAYALYVKELGDVDSARDLLRKGTEVDKRHAPAWQAWGVLETDYSTAKIARDVFQQGIWACAQPGGGQSGGRRCARLWQAWGCLEAQEGEHAAARRCFSRALDADPRNVAAVTAWTSMEADLGNFVDARSIFQSKFAGFVHWYYLSTKCLTKFVNTGTLKLFPSPSDDKMAIWRAWEVMEERTGNSRAAQIVFQRSMSDSMSANEEESLPVPESPSLDLNVITTPKEENTVIGKRKEKLELSRLAKEGGWDSDVWMNNGSIEGKVPERMMKKLRNRR